jgi:hypothetical protein
MLDAHKLHLRSLEFFLADTCNLRCRECSASSPFLKHANLPDLELFGQSLDCLAQVVECDQLKLLGGEPLLNPNICAFMRRARDSQVFHRIRVTTNGLLLPHMSDEFWQLADVVEISLYPSVRSRLTDDTLEELRRKGSAIGTALEVNPIDHFMTAVSDTRIEDPRLIHRIYATCGEAHDWSCHLLYRDRLYRCSRVHTLDRYLSGLGVDHENFTEMDGLLIDGRDSLRADIEAYLKSPDPLLACSFCLGTSGSWTPHVNLTVDEIRARRQSARRAFDSNSIVDIREAAIRLAFKTWADARGLPRS